MNKKLIMLSSALILSSCAWVEVTPEGESVRLVQSIDTVESCKRLGNVHTKVVSKVVFERDAEKVAGELADMARNEAGVLGGDTIVPISEVVDGRRKFAVFQCFQNNGEN